MPTIKKSRRPAFSNFLAIVGGGIGTYLLFAIGFYWLVLNKPAVENGPVADQKASPVIATVVEAPVPATPAAATPPAVVTEPPISEAYAAAPPVVEEKPAAVIETPKPAPKRQSDRPARRQENRPSLSNASHNPYEFRSSW